MSCKKGGAGGGKVMCDASVCVHTLTCMLVHKQCPVTLIINPVPPVVCKERDLYPLYPHSNMTRYT